MPPGAWYKSTNPLSAKTSLICGFTTDALDIVSLATRMVELRWRPGYRNKKRNNNRPLRTRTWIDTMDSTTLVRIVHRIQYEAENGGGCESRIKTGGEAWICSSSLHNAKHPSRVGCWSLWGSNWQNSRSGRHHRRVHVCTEPEGVATPAIEIRPIKISRVSQSNKNLFSPGTTFI